MTRTAVENKSFPLGRDWNPAHLSHEIQRISKTTITEHTRGGHQVGEIILSLGKEVLAITYQLIIGPGAVQRFLMARHGKAQDGSTHDADGTLIVF